MNPRGLSALLAFSYVGSVYLFPGARESFRNDASVLWRRVVGVLIFTAISVFCYGDDWKSWAGFHGESTLRAVVTSIVLVHVLYMAPLLASGYPSCVLPKTSRDRLQCFRDYFVGPITEELVYRGLIVSIYRRDGLSSWTALSENFLYFGFAHLHHGLMQWLGGDASARDAAVSSFLHFVMTSLFGTYACFLLIRTGSIWPSVVSHMLCNFLGPPRLRSDQIWYVPALVAGAYLWFHALKFL